MPDAMELMRELQRAPYRIATLRTTPLPTGLPAVMQLAVGGDAADRDAAGLFLEQLLFFEGADSYRVLGVEPYADLAVIKQHYRALIRWLHPDRGSEIPAYAERVNRAWNDLRTPDKRQAYDRSRILLMGPGDAVMPSEPAPVGVRGLGWFFDRPYRVIIERVAFAMAGISAAVWLVVHPPWASYGRKVESWFEAPTSSRSEALARTSVSSGQLLSALSEADKPPPAMAAEPRAMPQETGIPPTASEAQVTAPVTVQSPVAAASGAQAEQGASPLAGAHAIPAPVASAVSTRSPESQSASEVRQMIDDPHKSRISVEPVRQQTAKLTSRTPAAPTRVQLERGLAPSVRKQVGLSTGTAKEALVSEMSASEGDIGASLPQPDQPATTNPSTPPPDTADRPGVAAAEPEVMQPKSQSPSVLSSDAQASPPPTAPEKPIAGTAAITQSAPAKGVAVPSTLTVDQAQAAVESVLQAYRQGDLDRLMAYMDRDARDDRNPDMTIREGYSRLFSHSRRCELLLHDVRWNLAADVAMGQGQYETLVVPRGFGREQRERGSIHIRVAKDAQGTPRVRLQTSASAP